MKMKHISLAVASAIGAVALPAQADLRIFADGVGQVLLVPYFSAQGGNDTLLNIANSDTDNGKAVKVRFRSALDSDDVYDFHVYLSPGDMWTGKVSMDAATGLAKMETSDASCTRPASVNGLFVTSRLDPDLSTEEKANQTREGYVEILNMADIPDDGTDSSSTTAEKESSVYYQTKHVNGVAPCTASVLQKIGTTANLFADLTFPTASLMANWTIINVPGASAFSGGATAMVVVDNVTETLEAGRVVYFDQNALQNNVGPATLQATVAGLGDTLAELTADNVLLQTGFAWANYDLPDLSTPYDPNYSAVDPAVQADNLSNALAAAAIANEYIVIPEVSANTDWVISMPTRRYHVAARGRTADGVSSATTGFYDPDTKAGPTGPFSNVNATASSEQVTRYASNGRSSCVRVGGYDYRDREERTPTEAAVGDVISPNTPEEIPTIELCGEVTVLGLNQSGSASAVMGGAVAYTNLDLEFSTGWSTLYLDNGFNDWNSLPAIGQAFVEAFNPSTPSGAATYGANWQHRYVAP